MGMERGEEDERKRKKMWLVNKEMEMKEEDGM